MTLGLHRFYGTGELHFITCSCYRRLPLLRFARGRDRFLSVLEQTRKRYRFVVVGYVIMPEHVHLLMSEPEVGTPSTVMQVVKQRTARALLPKKKRRDPRQTELFDAYEPRSFWQTRFYGKDWKSFATFTHNPVKRGMVSQAEDWRWSSYRFYFLNEVGLVKLNQDWGVISFRDGAA